MNFRNALFLFIGVLITGNTHGRKATVGSLSPQETVLFNEKTRFQDLLLKRKNVERNLASAENIFRVISLKREFALNDRDMARMPQDIVVNAGAELGLSSGQTLSVFRRVSIIDPYKDNQQKEIEIPFARIRVIMVGEGLSVARVLDISPVSRGPALGIRGILVGDYVTTQALGF